MQKQLQDYIHYYLGCEVEHMSGIKYVLTPLFLHATSHIENQFKLLLRPLSNMTEKDMKELLMITIPDNLEENPDAEDYDIDLFYNDGGNMVDEDVSIGANYSVICYEGQIAIRKDGSIHCFDEAGNKEHIYNEPKAFHYLLSCGFDLFNLIEAGLAIDKTSLKV